MSSTLFSNLCVSKFDCLVQQQSVEGVGRKRRKQIECYNANKRFTKKNIIITENGFKMCVGHVSHRASFVPSPDHQVDDRMVAAHHTYKRINNNYVIVRSMGKLSACSRDWTPSIPPDSPDFFCSQKQVDNFAMPIMGCH